MDANPILQKIAADAAQDDLIFATHNPIALRVQHLLNDPECAIDALGKLIAADPLLSARVLSTANSLAYNPGGRNTSELKSAIARLGFTTLRALAASIVVRQMRDANPRGEYRQMASRLWEHSAHVAALARVIARRITGQNPDVAFFAGIVHEVGSFYLIARAHEFPGLLSCNLQGWAESLEASVGRCLMHALEIPSPVVEAVETMWSGYLAMPPASLGDTLLLANRIAPFESPMGALDGTGRKGMPVELEIIFDDETLSAILSESAAEIDSLINTLKDE